MQGVMQDRYSCDTLKYFTDTLRLLLDAAWGNGWGVFTDEETTFDDPENMQLPYIVFHLVSRKPNEQLTPLKKKFFETIPDPLYKGHNVEIWRKWYDCKVAFVCYARTDREARYWANKLEAFIDTYVGHFKWQGMSELIFLGEGEAGRTRIQSGNLAARTLNYLIRIEEIRIVRGKLLEDLTIQVKEQQ